MRYPHPLLAAAFSSLLTSATLSAASGTWVPTAAGTYSWDTASNWSSNTIADGSGFTATFSSGTTGSQTITLDNDRIIGNLTFASHAWRLEGPGKLTLTGSSTPTITAGTQVTNILAVIDGAQGLSLSGSVTLSGNNTFSGAVSMGTGTLTLNHNNALGAAGGDVTVANTGQVVVANNIKISGETITVTGTGATSSGTLVGSGTSEWAGAVKLGNSARLGTFDAASQFTVSGVISNGATGNLFVSGLGTTILSGANDYTGTTQVYRGTLKIDAGNNRLPTGTAVIIGGTNDAAVFDLNGWSQTVASIEHGTNSGARTLTNSSDTVSTLTVNQTSGTKNFDGVVSGKIDLVKSGAGILNLTGVSNTFSGNITVNAGTLSLASAFIADTGSVYLLTGSILNLNYTGTDSIGALYIDGILQASGTYGRIGSGAQFETALITGNGLLSFAAIPEPSTLAALLGAGVLATAAFRRRRSA